MINTIIGTKKDMTFRFDTRGRRIPVTQISVEPNVVLVEKDQTVRLGFGQRKKAKKPQSKIVEQIGFLPRKIKNIRVVQENNQATHKTGDKITVTLFTPGDAVKVTGITKGHGFAGGMKRWNFSGGPKTHGQSDRHRAPGSIGQTTTPGRVFKGKKMAGHYGNVQFTVTNLEVIAVDGIKNMLIVKGAVPGSKNGIVVIEKTGKVKGYIAPPEEKSDEEEGEAKAQDKEEKTDEKDEKPKEGEENAKK